MMCEAILMKIGLFFEFFLIISTVVFFSIENAGHHQKHVTRKVDSSFTWIITLTSWNIIVIVYWMFEISCFNCNLINRLHDKYVFGDFYLYNLYTLLWRSVCFVMLFASSHMKAWTQSLFCPQLICMVHYVWQCHLLQVILHILFLRWPYWLFCGRTWPTTNGSYVYNSIVSSSTSSDSILLLLQNCVLYIIFEGYEVFVFIVIIILASFWVINICSYAFVLFFLKMEKSPRTNGTVWNSMDDGPTPLPFSV